MKGRLSQRGALSVPVHTRLHATKVRDALVSVVLELLEQRVASLGRLRVSGKYSKVSEEREQERE